MGVDLDGGVGGVALRPGDVAAATDDAGHVGLAVEKPRVDRRAGVAHQ
jgi:hypothetical protein